MLTKAFRQVASITSAILYLTVSIVCAGIPLLNYLGYEFSAVIALLSSFVAGLLTIRAVKDAMGSNTSHARPEAAFKQATLLNVTLILIPLVIILANALFVKNCSIIEGVGFYLLLPVVSVLFSAALGLFCAVLFRRAKTMFILFVIATLVEVLLVGYATPAIFSYNFFYGYFPGVTYDEALGISLSLVAFRVVTLVLAAALVWMARLLLRNIDSTARVWEKILTLLGLMVQGRNVFVTGALATFIIVAWWFRGELGFDSSRQFIQHKLGKQYTTANFRIYYSKDSYSDDEIRWIAAEHEFRLKQITAELHLVFKGAIESYIYPSAAVKQRLMGAGNTNVAKPWSGQIHVTQQSLDATLKHELVHVLAAPFGMPIINASLSTGLVEGLAMAIEWDWGNRTLHQYAAAMRKFGVGPDISSIMSLTGFAAQSSSISYVLAGSFCRYLIDTHGIRPMMRLYRSNDYENLYGKSLHELMEDWQRFLQTIPVEDRDRDAVDVLFRRPPIFQKVCARVIAARNKEAGRAFLQRDFQSASALYQRSFEEARVYDALSGYIASSLRLGEYRSIVSIFDTAISRSGNQAQYLPLFVNVGMARWGLGDTRGAQDLFTRVETADVGEQLTETAIVCRMATDDAANREALFQYLKSAPPDSARIQILDTMVGDPEHQPLPLYLKGKVLFRLKRWEETIAVLEQLRMPETRLEAIRLKTIAMASFRLQRFEDAKLSFWRSLNFIGTAAGRDEVEDWLERCEWVKGNLAPMR